MTARVNELRKAIQNNELSFPAPVPIFTCRQYRADIQWRIVELYFVRGWSSARIGERYNIGETRVHQLLREWTKRAMAVGYLQEITSAEMSTGLN